jgi:hypothetical protein
MFIIIKQSGRGIGKKREIDVRNNNSTNKIYSLSITIEQNNMKKRKCW